MTIIQKGGKMSTKLVHYKDVCAALIPILEDMLEMGNFKQVTDTIEALVALKDADLAKAVKEYCKAQPEDCKGCKYHNIGGHYGCLRRDGRRPTMQARIKSLVLPEAPKYEGNVGSSAWTRPWYETEKDLTVVTVSPWSPCHHGRKCCRRSGSAGESLGDRIPGVAQ